MSIRKEHEITWMELTAMGDCPAGASRLPFLSVAPSSFLSWNTPVKDSPLSLYSLHTVPGLIKTWAIMAVLGPVGFSEFPDFSRNPDHCHKPSKVPLLMLGSLSLCRSFRVLKNHTAPFTFKNNLSVSFCVSLFSCSHLVCMCVCLCV